MSKSTDSSGTLSLDNLRDAFNKIPDSPNPPISILTPTDIPKRKYMGVYMGMPIYTDPFLGKDEILVEYRDGRRECLNAFSQAEVNDLLATPPAIDTLKPSDAPKGSEKAIEKREK